jgi:hypothetical protein
VNTVLEIIEIFIMGANALMDTTALIMTETAKSVHINAKLAKMNHFV